MPTDSPSIQIREASTAHGSSPLCPVPSGTLSVVYEAEGRVFFPTSPVSIWRGQLGAALRRAAQARPSVEPSPYEQLFRTPRTAVRVPDRPARILGPVGLAGEHVPHPFSLRMAVPCQRAAPLRLAPGDTTNLRMEVIGTAIRHLPALTAALDGLGQDGLGRAVPQPSGPDRRGALRLSEAMLQVGRVSLRLYDGRQWRLPASCSASLYDRAGALLEAAPAPPDRATSSSSVHLRFDTPVHLVRDGRPVDDPSGLTTAALAQACYRRWAALSLCYGPEPPSTATLDAAYEEAQTLGRTTRIAGHDLDSVERTRYSARQERTRSRTGLEGAVRLAGPARRLAQWRRWVRTVGPLHLGKATSLGFGHVTVDE